MKMVLLVLFVLTSVINCGGETASRRAQKSEPQLPVVASADGSAEELQLLGSLVTAGLAALGITAEEVFLNGSQMADGQPQVNACYVPLKATMTTLADTFNTQYCCEEVSFELRAAIRRTQSMVIGFDPLEPRDNPEFRDRLERLRMSVQNLVYAIGRVHQSGCAQYRPVFPSCREIQKFIDEREVRLQELNAKKARVEALLAAEQQQYPVRTYVFGDPARQAELISIKSKIERLEIESDDAQVFHQRCQASQPLTASVTEEELRRLAEQIRTLIRFSNNMSPGSGVTSGAFDPVLPYSPEGSSVSPATTGTGYSAPAATGTGYSSPAATIMSGNPSTSQAQTYP